MLLPGVGDIGMAKLKSTTVLIVGLGGGGCAASHQLALSNFGRLILCDHDVVGASNLGRQYLHNDATIGIKKVISAQIALKKINPFIEIETISKPISLNILEEIKSRYDNLMIFVSVDKFHAHYLINKFCIENHIPAVHIAQLGFKGFLYVFDQNLSNFCFNCTINEHFELSVDPNSFDDSDPDLPYLAPIISIVCSTGVVEMIKMTIGITEKSLSDRLLVYRGIDHEDIFEPRQVNKSLFEILKLTHSSSSKRCDNCAKCSSHTAKSEGVF